MANVTQDFAKRKTTNFKLFTTIVINRDSEIHQSVFGHTLQEKLQATRTNEKEREKRTSNDIVGEKTIIKKKEKKFKPSIFHHQRINQVMFCYVELIIILLLRSCVSSSCFLAAVQDRFSWHGGLIPATGPI